VSLTTPAAPVPARDSALPKVDAEIFRQALARHPAGVAIVTLAGPAGLTVTSFSSASLDPPLLHHQGRFTRPEPGSHDER